MADRPLLVLHDEEEGHLVYDLLLLDDEETVVACFPRPVARFPLESWSCSFAVSGGSVVGVDYTLDNARVHDAVMRVGGYDYWERQPSPRARDAEGRLVRWMPTARLPFDAPHYFGSHKDAPAMLPVGEGDGAAVVRMDTIIFDGFETLRPLPDGGGWHATPLPKLPLGRMYENDVVFISAYFAVGTRVWISVTRKGTFSLDIAAANGAGGAWRTEGTWMLPFEGRALHVPELDAVIGLTVGSRLLCACDVTTTGSRPVVTRHVWRETFPWSWEECVVSGHHPASRPRDMPSLAYLGNGRFCICRPMSAMEPRPFAPEHIKYDASSFLVVEVKRLQNGELQLAKRGKTTYMRPPQGRQCPYIGFIQPAT